MRKRNLVTAVFVLLCLSGLAWGQGTTSKVVGTVTDPSGAVIPGTAVTLTNEATGVSFNTVSSEAGTYVFEAVQVGVYTVSVEQSAFKKTVVTGNRVTIGQPTTVNVTLQLGQTFETVSVTDAYELVQTSTSGNLGAIVDQKLLESFPILGTRGRNPLDIVYSQPGVVGGANTGGGVHVHGARDRAWNFTLDGIDTNETSAGGSNFSPLRTNPDSLTEFRIVTSNFTAEYGRSSGAQVAMVTRSGTNEYRGNLFWFYRTPRFNANEWENNATLVRAPNVTVGKRQYLQHIPGFSFGGPIFKNKTFFFTNFQWLRTRESAARDRIVYTPEARKGNWRYVKGARNLPAGVTGAVVDYSGNVLPGINIGSYAVPNNDPQALGLSSQTQTAIGKTPMPNNYSQGDGLNLAAYSFTALQREKQHDSTVKIDHVINSRNTAFFRYSWGQQNTTCDTGNDGEERFPGLGCWVNTERSPRNWAANWRWNPTARITNEFVVGKNHFTFNFDTPTADPKKVTFSFGDITQPDLYQVGNLRTINTYQFVDNFSYLRGAHAFKFGANIRLQKHTDERGSVAGQNVSPTVDFSTGVNTVDPAAFKLPADINQTFDRPALERSINFLLGRVGNITQGFVAAGDQYAPGGTLFIFDARYPEADFYWQDAWKMRRNLMVDLGLRWELKWSPSNPEDRILAPNQPIKVGAAPSNTVRWSRGQLYKHDLNNLSPSVGFAWDPFDKGKTSIRANYRLSYDRIATFGFSSAIFQSAPGQALGVVNTDFGQKGGRLTNLPSLAPTAKPADGLQPAAVSSNTMTVVDPDFRMPKTNMWSMSIQHEVWRRTVASISYIGRRGVGLFGAYDVNQVEMRKNGFLEAFNAVKAGGESDLMNKLLLPDTRRGTAETGSQMVRRLYSSQLNLNSAAAVASAINSRIQNGRSIPDLAGLGPHFFIPYPQYTGSMRVIDSNDYSTYHAMEATLERPYQAGFSFVLGYTLAKSLDTRSFDPSLTILSTANSQSASSTPFDINNRRLNYALSDFDRTHVFNARFAYDLPLGKGKRWLNGRYVDKMAGGWSVAGITVIQGGRPMTIYSGSNTISNIVQTPANCSGCDRGFGAVYDDPVGYKFYLNPTERATFSTPAAGTFGNTGRNYLRGPGSFNIDLGILKKTHITEAKYVEFRCEFTNLTNTPTFGFPTATVTSSLFGRIGTGVISGSRKMQLALKFYF